ncbi:pyruvate kinase, barrel domain protein, partial [Vibrio parahaemolyticus V-223/04]
MIENPP